MPTVKVLGADLYYERYGQGPALLFAHGLGGSHLVWWQQVPYFRERYTCLTIDHPGFGFSGQPAGENWSFVDCLEGLLDALEIDRVCLVAQSMGGKTCLGYTLRHPARVQALVMASTMLPLELPEFGDYRPAAMRERQALQERGIFPACGERMAREQPALHFLYGTLSALNGQWHSGNWPPGSQRVPAVSHDDLRGYNTPTLFAFGEEDVIMPPRILELAAAAVPGARVARFAGAGHSVYFEQADEWNRVVDGFLREVLEGGR